MTDKDLLIDDQGAVNVLTLNRPERLNALSLSLEEALKAAFRTFGMRENVRAVILTGAGRAFSAGVDLKELEKTGTAARDWLGPNSLAEIMRACPVPVIGAVNGFAITGGLELALLCDFIIASEEARFADTHARVGLTPSWGMTQLLPRRIGLSRATQMSLTGAFVMAEQAVQWGLVNEVVPASALGTRTQTIAQDIASTDTVTASLIRTLLREGSATTLEAGLALEAATFQDHLGTLSPDDVARNRSIVQERGRSQSAVG